MTIRQTITSGKNIWLLPILVFTGAFAVRFYLAFFSNIITPDGILYIRTAKLIELGESKKLMEFTFIHLYPFLVILAHKIIPDWELAGRMTSVLMGSLAVIPFFLLIKGMFNIRIALVSSLFYVISPRLADYSSDVLREPTFWFFSMMALWLAWEGLSRGSLLCMAFAGIFSGLSSFARIEGIAVFVIISLWIIWYFWKIKPDLRKLFLCLFVFIFTLPIVLLPFTFLFRERLGKWDFGFTLLKIWLLIISKSKESLELTTDLIQAMPPELPTFIELAKDHKYVIFFSDIILKLIKSINIVFAVFAIAGIFRRKNTLYNKKEALIIIWFGVFFLTVFLYISKVYYFSTRHGLLMGIPVIIWAGIGFFELKEWIYLWLKKVCSHSFLAKNITAIFILVILIAILPKTLSPGGYEKRELKKAGIYLKGMGYSGIRFAGEPSLYRVAFYADSEYDTILSGKTNDELVGFMKENKTNLLIFDEKSNNIFYMNLQNNIDFSVFEKINLPEFEKYREYKISVYRLKNIL
ncbi:MAG: glycosyltransferase family 39 protein [Proteobacteria bacterium]|nr:glycosyltransferase family 39 protein [Pseudomonadota bacterium]